MALRQVTIPVHRGTIPRECACPGSLLLVEIKRIPDVEEAEVKLLGISHSTPSVDHITIEHNDEILGGHTDRLTGCNIGCIRCLDCCEELKKRVEALENCLANLTPPDADPHALVLGADGCPDIQKI